MAQQPAFDLHTFIAKVDTGSTLMACHKQHPIFTQGEASDAVFYIQEGQVKLTVVSAQGKEAVMPSSRPST